MRRVVIIVMTLLLVLGLTGVASADFVDGIEKSSHKIVTKHDHSGAFTGNYGAYNWGGFSSAGTEWTFKIHAKEAVTKELSKGTVHFYGQNLDLTEVNVVGQVEYAHVAYPYWPSSRGDVLLLAGTTMYQGAMYYFMYLESEATVWIALSTSDYAPYVATNTVFPQALRAYQLHSNVVADQFDLPEKPIH